MSEESLARANRVASAASAQKFKEDSRERLKRIVAKKFRTAFVFPLAEVEKVFGKELWGHGLPDEALSVEQRANRERWDAVRTAILTNGNTQARAVQAELDLHDVTFKGYRMDFAGGKHES